jgi:hypothetical protein
MIHALQTGMCGSVDKQLVWTTWRSSQHQTYFCCRQATNPGHLQVIFILLYAPWRAPHGVQNGGLPISMWGSHLSSGRC